MTQHNAERDNLLPCPFCGGEAEHDAAHWNGRRHVSAPENTGHAVYCADMGCAGCPSFSTVYETFEEATDAWNTRSRLDQLTPAHGVTVKPLKWEGDGHWTHGPDEGWMEEADTAFGWGYSVEFGREGNFKVESTFDWSQDGFETPDEAKAAAQADYERRVLAALELSPQGAGEGPLSGKYGNVIRPFVRMMEAELHANCTKGDRPGWLALDRKTGLLEIFYHLAKMQKAVKDDDQSGIREYGADVANMAMMLVDICGALEVEPTITQEPVAGDLEVLAYKTPFFETGRDGELLPIYAEADAAASDEKWVPLTDHTEATRIIRALEAERDNLHGSLFAESEAVQFYRAASIDNRKRAEKAEANLAEAVDLLRPFAREAVDWPTGDADERLYFSIESADGYERREMAYFRLGDLRAARDFLSKARAS